MYEQIEANKRNSFLLVAFFFLFLVGFGALIAFLLGENFWFNFIFFMIIALIITFIQYSFADKEVLAIAGAVPASEKQYPTFVHAVEGLAIAAGLPTPKAYVINSPALNAFATGKTPETSYIVATTGLIERLDRNELEGVVAHEMSHIQNYDIKFMLFAAVMAGIITLIANFFLRSMMFRGGGSGRKGNATAILFLAGIILAILAPISATLIRMAISRQREFLADANGVMLTRYPAGLVSALRKISKDTNKLATANQGMAHLYISDPFKASLFSTHPPIAERIKRLEQM